MRRFGVALTIVVLACAGIASTALAKTTSLTKISVDGAVGVKPTVLFSKPFAAKTSANRLITPGTGTAVAKNAKVAFDYVVIDGRTGKELETSFGAGPITLPLSSKTAPAGLVKGLVGANIGSRVLIAIAPKEGLTKQARKGVKKGDTLLFVLDVKSVRSPLAKATGEAVTPIDGLPTVVLDAKGTPTVTVPKVPAPTDLVAQVLIKGAGPAVTSGQTITAHYVGVIYGSGKTFDSSWARGTPADFAIGKGQVIPGWDKALVGQTVGSQVLLVIPPADGYGTTGNSQAGISGTDTLVFVVDILDAY